MIDREKIKTLVDGALLDAYSTMLEEESKAQDYINIFWDLIEDTYSYILKYIRLKIPETASIHIDIKDLLYDDLDEERIKKYYEEFIHTTNTLEARSRFLAQLSKIYITETGLVKDRIFISIGKKMTMYLIFLCVETSHCGEIGGEELLDISWVPISNMEAEADYEDEWCNHPNCPGHIVDIEVREKEEE